MISRRTSLRPRLRAVPLLLLLGAALPLAACRNDNTAGPGPAPAVDAAPPGPDLACEPAGCVAEPNEDCNGCMRHIGECCYKDVNLGSTPVSVNGLALSCSDLPSCAACCNECKALPCDEMIRRGNCPFMP